LKDHFEEEEVKRGIMECDGEKAPGPDRYTMAVFHEFWDVMRGDLMNFFKEFYENGVVNKCVNETYICLIPKRANSCKLKDFRPISLGCVCLLI